MNNLNKGGVDNIPLSVDKDQIKRWTGTIWCVRTTTQSQFNESTKRTIIWIIHDQLIRDQQLVVVVRQFMIGFSTKIPLTSSTLSFCDRWLSRGKINCVDQTTRPVNQRLCRAGLSAEPFRTDIPRRGLHNRGNFLISMVNGRDFYFPMNMDIGHMINVKMRLFS